MAASSQPHVINHSIPFRYPHGGIVIGKRGDTVKAIAAKTNTTITTHKADHSRNMPLPFFLVQTQHHNAFGLHSAVIEIQTLLLTSMMNTEHKHSKNYTHNPPKHPDSHVPKPTSGDGY